MDRISHLPDFIAHHILSFLSIPAELVRMSVLSKTWFHLTASFPILDFSLDSFTSTDSFLDYLEYTTSRFCLQNVTAHTLKLIGTLEESAELDILDRCLDLVFKKGVKVLLIDLINPSKLAPDYAHYNYRLPNTLLSVSELKSLTIRGCALPSSLMLDVVKFKFLSQLELHYVQIDDEVIKRLTTGCPLLQVFCIISCYGFKRFCIYGHLNLQKVTLHDTPVEIIDIEAPNLSSLTIVDILQIGIPQMNLASCKRLTTVTYFGEPLSNSCGFNGFLSNFPFIETLFLCTNYKSNSLKFSGHSLRTLALYSNYDLADIEFNTPNLGLFIYNGRLPPQVAKHSSACSKACMQCYLNGCIDAHWFHKLRLFLDKKSGIKVLNLYIHAKYSQKFIEMEKLKAIELPPYELEHVELQLENHEESMAFVDAVLWCCRPQSLSFRSSIPFEEQSDVINFTYKKLLQQEDEGHTKLQIVSSGVQKRLMNLKALSMGLPHEENTVSFIKEKTVLLEEAR